MAQPEPSNTRDAGITTAAPSTSSQSHHLLQKAHRRRRSSVSVTSAFSSSSTQLHHEATRQQASAHVTAPASSLLTASKTPVSPPKSTWSWSLSSQRRRSASIGTADYQRSPHQAHSDKARHSARPTSSNGRAGSSNSSSRRREDSAIAVGSGKGLLKSPHPEQKKQGSSQHQNFQNHSNQGSRSRPDITSKDSLLQSSTSPKRATTRSPPPVLRVEFDSIPTLPRLAYDGDTSTGRASAGASPVLDLGAANLAGAAPEPHPARVSGGAASSSAGNRSPAVQGLGLSVESRYSRRGGPISASRSQESLSILSDRGSDRTASPYLSQGPHSPPSVSAAGGRGGEWQQELAVDMSGRRRSISSSNARQTHESYRNYDTEAGSDRQKMSENDGTESAPRGKDRREQDKKTMLSKALQKAHTAVLLDNAHNFEGAIEAYDDACRLLGQVLIRSAGEDDRRKLDAIVGPPYAICLIHIWLIQSPKRTTYTNRIEELHQINREAEQASGKNLPARPMSNESLTPSSAHDTPQSHRSLEPEPRSEPAANGPSSTKTRSSANTVASQQSVRTESSIASQPKIQEPPKQAQVTVQPVASINTTLPLRSSDSGNELLQPATFKSTEQYLTIGSPMDPSYATYAPPPLSPRRMPTETESQPSEQLQPPQEASSNGHSRANSNNSISWLDTIDESGASSDGSSVHSVRDGELNRKHVRMPSDTEAEFDAALDAAVEAAYADGMEPFDYDEPALDYRSTALSDPVKQMVDTERKRLSDRSQMIQQAHARTKQLTKSGQFATRQSRELYRMSDDIEEERILEEIQKDFGFDFGLQSKSTMPRQSDSSEYSGASTYHSSMSSSKATALTSLSTVSESSQDLSSLSKSTQNLPRLSEESSQRDSLPLVAGGQFGGPLVSPNTALGVRSRRMSGQNAKQLKIETSMPPKKALPQPPPTAPPTTIRIEESQSAKPLTAKSDTQLLPDTIFQPSSQGPSTTPLMPPQTFVSPSSPVRDTDSPSARDAIPTPTSANPGLSGSPGPEKMSRERPSMLKKNKSSISLKTRNMSISSPGGSDIDSVGTPLSTSFTNMSNNSRKNLAYANSAIPPTPGLPSFGDNLTQVQSHGNLFESDLHSPYVPGSPNPMAANAPIPLEPCPDSHLLRPYWLMRCFYQTIAHPRGGYLSMKLFVPRDVWRVKGVKIKAMEEKIANCDYLTAGLQKLNSVDSFDAAAVLEEMQQFELVLDSVQGNLSKKLGSDVSVQGIQTLFRDAPALSGETGSSADGSSGSRAVSQGKSFLSSMRKLRSKSSAVALTPTVREPGSKDSLTMSTLPMTNLANPRFAKRDPSKLEVSGPHAQYMESLAKLCDAVQVIGRLLFPCSSSKPH